MSVHVMQSLISLRHVDKMLVVADAKNNACAIVYINMMMVVMMMMMMMCVKLYGSPAIFPMRPFGIAIT